MMAYIYGSILFNIKEIKEDKIRFYFDNDGSDEVMSEMKKLTDDSLYYENGDYVISDRETLTKMCSFLNIEKITSFDVNKIDFKHVFSKNSREESLEFIKAFFEKYGSIYFDTDKMCYTCNITCYSKHQIDDIDTFLNIPCEKPKLFNLEQIIFCNVNTIDFLGAIYWNTNMIIKMDLYNMYMKIIGEYPKLKFMKISENAVTPTKANFSDVGFDLSIIGVSKQFNSKTKLYNTGIKLNIPVGYYVEIVPRSSISKSGYILANSIGIIDCSYKGELFVALAKLADEIPDIEFPFKCCQLIMKKQVYPELVELKESHEIETSKRSDGGFGSSDVEKKK
jgi:deoxyuridine 5'-triphosphate nucleotidohydrolase